MYAALIGSDPHSRHSSFQQEVDQNNLACIQFLSDSHHSPLISPGCYFCCCKPVIIQGMKWTEKHVGKKNKEKCISSQRTGEEDEGRAHSLTSRAYSVHFSERASWFANAHTSFHFLIHPVCLRKAGIIFTASNAPFSSPTVIHSVHFPPWYVKTEGLPLRSLVRHWNCKWSLPF